MNAKPIQAVLIDTVSIQRYIFGSNRLKENLGASFLVQNIYEAILKETLKEIFPGQEFDLGHWKKNPEEVFQQQQNSCFAVGYIGGGNALLFFQHDDLAEAKKTADTFIKAWTRRLLVETPGITTAIASDQFDLNAFQSSLKTLFALLEKNKARYIPQTVLPRHGITAECSHSGLSGEIWYQPKVEEEKGEYISGVIYAKLASVEQATKKLEKILQKTDEGKKILEKYTFTADVEELGQRPGEESHIAIVHIDGNGMGERFKRTTSLPEIRNLAKTVQEATESAFRQLIIAITKDFDQIQKEFDIQKQDGKFILPLRPIIIGGDDITFVANGKLGIYCAQHFLQAFAQQQVSDQKPLSACAGVAITRTKFPFFRGYELADDLCQNAKRWQKEYDEQHKTSSSWLDFHLAYGGFFGTLKDIRKDQYHYFWIENKLSRGLLWRPYLLNSHPEFGLDTLIRNTRQLKHDFPKSKIMDLRTALAQGEEAARMFIKEQEFRGKHLPKIEGRHYENSGFEHKETPYFDMIELLDCYPEFAL